MSADAKDLPKYARVARAVRGQVADGTLRPGQPAPSGAALSRVTGYSTLTCRRALRLLIAEGVLTPGPSPNARPRVAGGAQPPGERDLAAAGQALSASLAARRRAHGLTQPGLAGRAGVSVTTVGHAETGRLWQSRSFWEQADAVLDAGGELLTLHDAFRAAASSQQRAPAQPPEGVFPLRSGGVPPAVEAPPGRDSPDPVGPASVTIVWGNGTTTTIRPPQAPSA
jgi:DNA-binding transcriptional MocR family regulator